MKQDITFFLVTLMAAASALAQSAPPPATPLPVMPGVPPAMTLPDVSVPSVMPPAAPDATSGLPATEAPPLLQGEAAPLAENAPFSFGDVPFSLMYTPQQAEKMRTILTVYETAKRNKSTAPIQIEEEVVALAPVAAIDEPNPYPVFTLRSIVYRDTHDWTVWIGNLRVTPRTNTQEVMVTGLTPDRGSFLWKPTYGQALLQRSAQNSFAPTKPVAHKMTKPNMANFDTGTGQVSFSLRPNQTFVPGYMATFEGKMPAPILVPLEGAEVPVAAPSTGANMGTGAPGSGAGTLAPGSKLQELYQKGSEGSSQGETLDTLLKNQQNVQGFAPRSQ